MTQLAAPAARPARIPAPLPPAVKAAVALWVVCALLGLVNAGLGFVLAAFGQPVNDSQRDPVGVAIGVVFAVLVLVLGLQVGTGRATGTRGAGTASLFLALLYAGLAALSGLMTSRGQDWGGAENGLYTAAALMAAQAVLLLAAGFLAQRGQTAYTAWRAARTAPAGG
jgi:hypothetical protein